MTEARGVLTAALVSPYAVAARARGGDRELTVLPGDKAEPYLQQSPL